MPGEVVNMDSGRYVVSFHVEPMIIHYPIGVSMRHPTKSDPESGYLYRDDAQFVDASAAMNPRDDYRRSLTAYLLTPEELKKRAPMKHEFMDFLYGRASL